MNSAQQTRIKVEVTTGKVDMATSTLSLRVQIAVFWATHADDRFRKFRQMVNDNRADQHGDLVKKGSGEVTREGQTIPLESYTKAAFSSNSKEMIKTKVLQPPTLICRAHAERVCRSSNKGREFFLGAG